MRVEDARSGLGEVLRTWWPPIAAFISSAISILTPLSPLWKLIVIAAFLCALCGYLYFGRKKPIFEGSSKGPYVYPERVRFGALLGLVSIPSLVIGIIAAPVVFPTNEISVPTLMPPANPLTIDPMGELSNWAPSFCDEACGGSHGRSHLFTGIVPGKTDNALEIIYHIEELGWVLITKSIDPSIDLTTLSKTTGISFFYKGNGASNTLELKLVLRYPNDPADTAYGASWKMDTSGQWTRIEARYEKDIKCWWPDNLCEKHGDIPLLTAVKRIDLAISNRKGDTPGLGKVAFDDLVGITP